MSDQQELNGAVQAVLDQAHAECRDAEGHVDPARVEVFLAATVVNLARGSSPGFLRLAEAGGGPRKAPHTPVSEI
jgi:hypothetical protein